MKRIKIECTRGWRMPEDAVYVDRPSKLGNPFFKRDGVVCFHLNRYTSKADRKDNRYSRGFLPMWPIDDDDVVSLYRRWLNGETRFGDEASTWLPEALVNPPPTTEEIREFVNGRDVACRCSLNKPCHADVIMERAR